MKTCNKCKEIKPKAEFQKNISRKDGLQYHCKACNSRVNKEHYEKNKEQVRARHAAYVSADPEKNRARGAKYYYANLDKVKSKRAAYYDANKDAIQAVNKAYQATTKGKEVSRQTDRTRRALKRNAEGSHTASDVRDLLILQKHKCACCKVGIKNNYHVDHVIALSVGGSNFKDNLQILCPYCNRSKNAKHPIDFMQSRGFLL